MGGSSKFGGSTVQVDAAGALTGDGSVGAPLAVGVDGVTVTIVNDVLVAPSGGGGTIGGTLGGADNVVPRSNGTGGATLQASALVVDDAGGASGLTSMTVSVPTQGTNGLSLANATYGGDPFTATLKNDGSVYLHSPTSWYADTGPNGTSYLFMDDTGLFEVNTLLADGTTTLTGGAQIINGSMVGNYDRSTPLSGSVNANQFTVTLTPTTGSPSDLLAAVVHSMTVGQGGVAAMGSAWSLNNTVIVAGSGDDGNEYAANFNLIRGDIGTGYTQTTGPAGGYWYSDTNIYGPIAVQPAHLLGQVINIQQFYNGSPSASPSVGVAIVTAPGVGGGSDAPHSGGTIYPIDYGLTISGESSGGGVGFTTGILIGGTPSPWGEAASHIGTGIKLQNCTTDIDSNGGVILFKNLPTADPSVAGQLWNSSGTLMVSAG